LAGLARREGREVAGRGRNHAAAPDRLGSEVKKKKGRGGEGLTGGARSSAPLGKRKGKEERWAGAGNLMGRLGRKGKPTRFLFFFFFQTSFSNHFSFQIQIKLFQTSLKNFIDFLETTQATKNHASQKMMHIHLLSLSLLNYL
jgi:hypothetical protein